MEWASYQIRKIADCACTGNAGNVFPATAGYRSRHASRHVRHARAVMHAGIDKKRFPLKWVAGKRSRRMRNPQFYVSDKRPMTWRQSAYAVLQPNATKLEIS